MKILVLSKRQYTGKDLLDDRFGRLRELPLELAKLGHEVTALCLSYRPKKEGRIADTSQTLDAHVCWHSLNLGFLLAPGLIYYFLKAYKLVRESKPDLVWACSDSFHAIFGVCLGKYFQTKCIVDLYDNFESFRSTRIPGVLPLFKRAVRNADGVTCVSQRLKDRIVRNYQPQGPAILLHNAVRPDLFFSQDRNDCRKRLGLPEDVKIIGTAGALYANRGIDVLFRGFELLAPDEKGLHLAIAGLRDRRTHIPKGPRIHDLGVLPLEKVPIFFNALDVAVICNRDSSFGRYSFPQKAYEIIACRVPLIAASVGTMRDLLAPYPQCLFEPEDPESFAGAARLQLQNPVIANLPAPAWSDAAKHLEDFFESVVNGAPGPQSLQASLLSKD